MNVCVMVMVLVYSRGGLLISSLTSTHFAEENFQGRALRIAGAVYVRLAGAGQSPRPAS